MGILAVLALSPARSNKTLPAPVIVGSRDYDKRVAHGAIRCYLTRTQEEIEAARRHAAESGAGGGIYFGDGESGPGVQYRYGPWMPATMALGAADDPALTRRFAVWAGQGFRRLGLDVVLAPLADIFETSAPSVLGWRCFGDTPEKVMVHARAYADGLYDGGVVPVIKHFPGHGMTAVDTHEQLGASSLSFQDVRRRHAASFSFLRGEGKRYAVMMGHLATGERGHYSLAGSSPEWMRVLRQEIGFDGLVMTDSANMKAIQDSPGGEPRFFVEAIRSGVDLLLEPARLDQDYLAWLALQKGEGAPTKTSRESSERFERFVKTVQERRGVRPSGEAEWLRAGDELAMEVLQAGSIEFGGGGQTAQHVAQRDTMRLVGDDLSSLNLRPLLQELGMAEYPQIPRLNTAIEQPTSGSRWCLVYWRGGTGPNLSDPWRPQELEWIETAGKAGATVSVLVLGNPLAGKILEKAPHVRGIVVWGRSPASCRAAGRWLRGALAPRGRWPFTFAEGGVRVP